jgi:hypothetical protein
VTTWRHENSTTGGSARSGPTLISIASSSGSYTQSLWSDILKVESLTFVRYGNPTTIAKTSAPDNTQFAKSFITTFAPEILKGYLQEIDKWVSKGQWLSKPSLSYTLIFLEECVKPKAMWDHLKPHMENLIAHLIFPIMCQSDEDIELFQSDPPEYLHRKLNYYEEVSSPDVAATNFLVALTKSRKKQTFSILTFINGVVSRYESAPDEQKQPREKEGALRMIG